jgi:hypothetical protein
MNTILVLIARLVTILTITILTGCATPQTAAIESPVYHEKSNYFSPGETHYYGDSITLKLPEVGKPDFSFFRLNFTITNNARLWHASTFYLSKALIMDPTIIFVLDGKVYTFTSEPHTKQVFGRLRKGYVEETNQFLLPVSLIDNLIKSTSVVIRLSGQNYSEDKALDADEIGHFIYFINHVNSLST